jgi:hypothetical protein
MPKLRKKSTASYRADVRSLPNYVGTTWNDLRATECRQVIQMAGELPGTIEDRHLQRVIMARPLGYWPKHMTKGSGSGVGQKPIPGQAPTDEQQLWMQHRREESRVSSGLLRRCGVLDAPLDAVAKSGTRSFGSGAANNVEQGSESGGAPEQESAPAPGNGEGGGEPTSEKMLEAEQQRTYAAERRENAAAARAAAAAAIEQGNMAEAAEQANHAVHEESKAEQNERHAKSLEAEARAEAAAEAEAEAEAEAAKQRAAVAAKTGWLAVLQEARKRCQQDPDGGRLISTGHMSAVPPWVSNGATRAQVIDAFTQSWEPEEIAKIFGHVEEGLAVAQGRRDGNPIDAVMAWDADIAAAVEACPNHLMDFPNEQLPAMLDRLKLFSKVWAVGTTRCGKTVAARQCAAVLGQRFIECTLNEEMMLQQLVGARDAHGVFHTGPLLDAYENGGIILLDEFDKADPGMSGGCNAYLNMEDCIAIPDRSENPTAKRHPDFKIIVATNTFGNGSDGQYLVQQQSLDLVARFEHQGLQMKFTYSESVERNILGEYA